MAKRKRGESEHDEAHDDGEEQSQNWRKARLAAQVTQGTTLLRQALKFARGFERQKLGRRQKAASTKKAGDELVRLREEVAVLKVMCKAQFNLRPLTVSGYGP